MYIYIYVCIYLHIYIWQSNTWNILWSDIKLTWIKSVRNKSSKSWCSHTDTDERQLWNEVWDSCRCHIFVKSLACRINKEHHLLNLSMHYGFEKALLLPRHTSGQCPYDEMPITRGSTWGGCRQSEAWWTSGGNVKWVRKSAASPRTTEQQNYDPTTQKLV